VSCHLFCGRYAKNTVSIANFLCKNILYRPYTVFAPTNDAFALLSADNVALLQSPEGKDQLIQILQYHVTPGNLYSSMFIDGEISMLNGETATMVVGPPVMIENAMVSGDQVLAANGVIHPINEVLVLPTQAVTAAVTAEPVTPAPVTAAPVLPVTAAPVTALPVTMPPAVLPLTQPPVSAVPGDSMVVVIGAQEAPASAPLPVLEEVDAESEDSKYADKNSKYNKDETTGNGAVLSAMESTLLGECQGDCKYNKDCATGLICVNSKGLTAIPGCQGSPRDGKLVSFGDTVCQHRPCAKVWQIFLLVFEFS
jgi:hypothetical protein